MWRLARLCLKLFILFVGLLLNAVHDNDDLVDIFPMVLAPPLLRYGLHIKSCM